MKRRNIVWFGSIVVFLPAVHYGLIVLAGFAVAAFFYELGKMSGTIDRSLRSEDDPKVSANAPSAIAKNG